MPRKSALVGSRWNHTGPTCPRATSSETTLSASKMGPWQPNALQLVHGSLALHGLAWSAANSSDGPFQKLARLQVWQCLGPELQERQTSQKRALHPNSAGSEVAPRCDSWDISSQARQLPSGEGAVAGTQRPMSNRFALSDKFPSLARLQLAGGEVVQVHLKAGCVKNPETAHTCLNLSDLVDAARAA